MQLALYHDGSAFHWDESLGQQMEAPIRALGGQVWWGVPKPPNLDLMQTGEVYPPMTPEEIAARDAANRPPRWREQGYAHRTDRTRGEARRIRRSHRSGNAPTTVPVFPGVQCLE